MSVSDLSAIAGHRRTAQSLKKVNPMSDVLSCRQLTANLKMIAGAIGCLNRNDVAQIISLGGVPCSKSRADSIIRSAGAEKMHPVILIFAEPE